jgi:epoxyqueuosine reductase
MISATDENLTGLIKKKVFAEGFDLCGIAPSRPLTERENTLRKWCSSGMNAGMTYLERNIEKRMDPSLLMPDVKSVIVTGLNYYSDQKPLGKNVPVISRYAYGNRYQDVIGIKLNSILKSLLIFDPSINGQSFVDTAPVHEKAWAVEAGLGWQGRNSVVINKKIGSFFFIGVILLNKVLEYDNPFGESQCGNCRLCIDNCPTGAINENMTIDARKCIANLTIENKGPIPEDIVPKLGGRLFGCDKCQEICPWNSCAKNNDTKEFEMLSEIKNLRREEWLSISDEDFKRFFRKSPLKRIKYDGFRRNVEAAISSLKNN